MIIIKGKKLKKLFRELGDMRLAIEDLTRKQEVKMAQVFQDLEALRVALNEATNKVAERIATLMQGLSNSMSDAEVTQVKTGLQAEVDRLKAFGANPNDPLPIIVNP